MTSYLQDPSEVLIYAYDFTPGLGAGETVTAHTVTAAGMTVAEVTRTGGKITAKLSGGAVGQSYTVTWQVTTSRGQVFERSDWIRVTQL